MSAFWDKVKKSKEEKKENPKTPVVKDEKKKTKKIGEDQDTKTDKVKKEKKLKKKSKKRVLSQQEAKIADKVLVSPRISEAAMNQQALGKYVFQVSTNATKQEIAKAIKAFYGVDVKKVNVTNYDKKSKNFRGITGSKKAFKKAIVTVKSGQSIDVFKENK